MDKKKAPPLNIPICWPASTLYPLIYLLKKKNLYEICSLRSKSPYESWSELDPSRMPMVIEFSEFKRNGSFTEDEPRKSNVGYEKVICYTILVD